MYFDQFSSENLESAFITKPESKVEIVNLLIEQHTLVSDKLLPEIDMHFWALMRNNTTSNSEALESIYHIFLTYKEQLEDHFYFEERLVFPSILRNVSSIDETTVSFIQKHDDFEKLLGEMIQEIHEKLNPFRDFMSLRVLELKLMRLSHLMEQHQVLEDNLFSH
jgi:iron-sulfur cluster repair protein YtfE (RIC family)